MLNLFLSSFNLVFLLWLGFGVLAEENFPKRSFLIEYVGERVAPKLAEEREKKRNGKHSYIYFF